MKRPIYRITLHLQGSSIIVRKYATDVNAAIQILTRAILKSDGWIIVKDEHKETNYIQVSSIVRITAKEEAYE